LGIIESFVFHWIVAMGKTVSNNPLNKNYSSEHTDNNLDFGFIADLIGHDKLIHCFKAAEKYYKKLTKQSEIIEDENAILLISEHLYKYNKNRECNRCIAEAVINFSSLDKNIREGLRNAIYNNGMTELSINRFGLSVKEIKIIVALLPFTSLKSLKMGYNDISDEGAKVLAASTTLTKLDLRGNEISDEGAKALAANSSLNTLDLGNNVINDAGVIALAGNSTLTKLSLWVNSIGVEGAKALAANSTLTQLDMGFNKIGIGDEGAKALAGNSTLIKLDLTDNKITDEGAKSLAGNSTLIKVDLYKKISDDVDKALAEKNPVKRYKSALEVGVKFPFPSLLRLSLFSIQQSENKQKIINRMKKWGKPFEHVTQRLNLDRV
jgi:Leucine Rich repeat